MGGDGVQIDGVDDEGNPNLQIRLSSHPDSGVLALGAETESVWIGPGFNEAGEKVLQVKLVNEDGTGQVGYWNLDGSFGEVQDVPAP